jgi:hypothetical protein
MLSLTCIKCSVNKACEEFPVRSNGYYEYECKACKAIYIKQYKANRQSGAIQKREYPAIENGGKVCSKCAVWKPLDAYQKRDTEHGYRLDCTECKYKQNSLGYYERKDKGTVWPLNERIKAEKKPVVIKVKRILTEEEINKKKQILRERRYKRLEYDFAYQLLTNQRSYVYQTLKKIGVKKENMTLKYLGCTSGTLKEWIEFQFDKDMNWQNYPKIWTIDHILPLSLFDLTKKEHQDIAFNWKNLQPLKDNYGKHNKLRCHEFWNSVISACRFIKLQKLDQSEYQGIRESICWLREKLR